MLQTMMIMDHSRRKRRKRLSLMILSQLGIQENTPEPAVSGVECKEDLGHNNRLILVQNAGKTSGIITG